jgi:hypothetical protein
LFSWDPGLFSHGHEELRRGGEVAAGMQGRMPRGVLSFCLGLLLRALQSNLLRFPLTVPFHFTAAAWRGVGFSLSLYFFVVLGNPHFSLTLELQIAADASFTHRPLTH